MSRSSGCSGILALKMLEKRSRKRRCESSDSWTRRFGFHHASQRLTPDGKPHSQEALTVCNDMQRVCMSSVSSLWNGTHCCSISPLPTGWSGTVYFFNIYNIYIYIYIYILYIILYNNIELLLRRHRWNILKNGNMACRTCVPQHPPTCSCILFSIEDMVPRIWW